MGNATEQERRIERLRRILIHEEDINDGECPQNKQEVYETLDVIYDMDPQGDIGFMAALMYVMMEKLGEKQDIPSPDEDIRNKLSYLF